MSSSQIAENYQLKWHSHLTNLNSSVATLYRNDKFADVLLFTSQSDGGCGIPAHKIILSSCSHFFASIFESNPTPPNSMVYIVLPPELSKRSIQILIQYMYSGEATVSNDILNEVLHGGELLKIRGLWRNKTPSNESSNSSANAPQYMSTSVDGKSTKGGDNDGCLYSDKPLAYEHPVHERNANNLSIIKESPVIVTSPTTHLSTAVTHKSLSSTVPHPHMHSQSSIDAPPPSSMHHLHHSSSHSKPPNHGELISTHLHQPPPPSAPPPSQSLPAPPQTIQLAQSHVAHELSHNSSIIVKKELAISGNDEMAIGGNIPASHYGLVSLQIAAASVKKAQSPPILKPRNKASVMLKQRNKGDSFIEKSPCGYQPPEAINENGNAQYEQEIARRYSDDNYLYGRDANDVPSGSHVSQQHHHHHHRSAHDVDHTSRHADKSRAVNHMKQQRSMTQHSIETMVEQVAVRKGSMNDQPSTPIPTPDAIRMLSIKQEPVEWTEFEPDNNLMEKANIEVNVKPELVYAKDGSDGEETEMQEPIYSPLTCELCSETFTIPADWVRHIESHSEPATHCVPKKRKRIEENLTENTAALRCDLCSMYFVTPAEWVRHVQNMHTETELALSNNSATLRRSPMHRPAKHMDSTSTGNDRCSATAQNLTSEKSCGVCKKMFPSYASMIIHKRTHTDKYQ